MKKKIVTLILATALTASAFTGDGILEIKFNMELKIWVEKYLKKLYASTKKNL